LGVLESASSGSTAQKAAALKRMSLIMGMMDGADVLEKNPGIQESNFNRRWHNSAINAHRVRSEGPGILDVILDDSARSAHTYTNQDLKLIHGPTESPDIKAEVDKEPARGPLDVGDGYSFSANKLMTPGGYAVEFTPTAQGHADITVTSADGRSFESRVYMPPIGISKMSREDRVKYLDSLKGQLDFMISDFEKTNPPVRDSKPVAEEGTDYASDFSTDATFRVPLLTFKGRINQEDAAFLSEISSLVDEGGLGVESVADNIYRITNPRNKKTFTIMISKAKKRIVGMQEGEDGTMIPHLEPSIEGFMHAIGYRDS
jgi:hypothetical protein